MAGAGYGPTRVGRPTYCRLRRPYANGEKDLRHSKCKRQPISALGADDERNGWTWEPMWLLRLAEARQD
jgi:hypothetical protein